MLSWTLWTSLRDYCKSKKTKKKNSKCKIKTRVKTVKSAEWVFSIWCVKAVLQHSEMSINGNVLPKRRERAWNKLLQTVLYNTGPHHKRPWDSSETRQQDGPVYVLFIEKVCLFFGAGRISETHLLYHLEQEEFLNYLKQPSAVQNSNTVTKLCCFEAWLLKKVVNNDHEETLSH